jgi:hypothetical protein
MIMRGTLESGARVSRPRERYSDDAPDVRVPAGKEE